MSWRWIPPLEADGRFQMALDRWMLNRQVQSDAEPMLRLYRWSRPTLSLGAHQRRLEPHWPELVAAGQIELVRRPSGGRAVLHAGELTYALACRPASRRRLEAYTQACGWLQAAFGGLGLPLRFGSTAAGQAQGRPSCFASGTAADLIHGDGANADGAKRIGSAQLWRGPTLLQHGSILLTPANALWRQVFREDPPNLPPLPCAVAELEQRLRAAAERHLCGGPLRDQPLGPEELQAVWDLTADQASPEPGEASPAACIDRATGANAIPSG